MPRASEDGRRQAYRHTHAWKRGRAGGISTAALSSGSQRQLKWSEVTSFRIQTDALSRHCISRTWDYVLVLQHCSAGTGMQAAPAEAPMEGSPVSMVAWLLLVKPHLRRNLRPVTSACALAARRACPSNLECLILSSKDHGQIDGFGWFFWCCVHANPDMFNFTSEASIYGAVAWRLGWRRTCKVFASGLIRLMWPKIGVSGLHPAHPKFWRVHKNWPPFGLLGKFG